MGVEKIMDLMFWIYVMWGAIAEFFIVVGCFLLIPIEKRAKTLSFLTKKAYGVIEIAGKGKHITKHLANFYEDYVVVRGGAYFLDPRYIYIKDGARCIHFDEKDAFEPLFFEDKDANAIKEIKSMSKKEQSALKARLTEEQIEALDKLMKKEDIKTLKKVYVLPAKLQRDGAAEQKRDPGMISAVFLKQKALAESEAFIKMLQQFKWLLIGAIIAAGIAAAFGYLTFDAVTNMGAIAG